MTSSLKRLLPGESNPLLNHDEYMFRMMPGHLPGEGLYMLRFSHFTPGTRKMNMAIYRMTITGNAKTM